MDVGDWLRSLGLEKYEPTFRANEIDDKLLTRLTTEDLKDLGVSAIGHRRKLLDAIAALSRSDSGTASNDDAPIGITAPLRSDLQGPISRGAERRQITVMFCDLVESTALAARLDPEEMQEVLRTYQNAVAGEIVRMEGHVAKLMGDGVLACFGWPKAHEDEAERAVRAGLAVVSAVERVSSPSGERLACRVGVATGLVVVGDLADVGGVHEEAVVGETPALAARLQQLAAPGTVVVAEATHQLLNNRFHCQALGEHLLKGWSKPVTAHRILSAATVESRFAARHQGAVLPMVGRDEELALLLRHWREAVGGEGRAVLVLGEPGIGKSRLARAIRDEVVVSDAAEVILWQCSPFHIDSPLWPIIEQLTLAAGFSPDDDTLAKHAKLAALLGLSDDESEDFALLATLVGAPPNPDPLAKLSPQERRGRTLEAFVTQVVNRAQRAPILFLLEDAHWLDPTSAELVERILDVIASTRVLLILTSRPDDEPKFSGSPHLTRLPLHRLGRDAAERIVGSLTAAHSFQDEIRSEIVARTDGVPLFIEEVTKVVLEASPGGAVAVPATLRDSLLARLDRSPPMKAVAQIAACIGREFDHLLLASVADLPPNDLGAGLEMLLKAELIFRRGSPPKTTYMFKHSLVRDAAYQSLLKPRRRELHGKIVEVLRSAGRDGVIEIIAYHATQAEHPDAAELWLSAGLRAAHRYANLEALRHFEQARALVVSSTGGASQLRLRILKAMGPSLFAVHGYAARVVEETYQAAADLAEQAGDEGERFRALRGLWNCFYARAELARSLRLAHELVALAEAKRDPVRLAVARRAVGSVQLNRGDFSAAKRELNMSVQVARNSELGIGILDYGEAPYVISHEYLAMAHLVCGEPDRALRLTATAIETAEELGHPLTLARTLVWTAVIRAYRREPDACTQLAERGLALCQAQSFSLWRAGAITLLAWSRAVRGDAEALLEIRSGLAAWRRTNVMLCLPMWLGMLADAALGVGQTRGVDAELADAERLARTNGEMLGFPELLRLQGKLAAMEGNWSISEQRLLEAIKAASAQGAVLFELRAARDLAQSWAVRGERQKASDLLSPVYERFAEGRDTRDLIEAKALLEELRS